MPHDQLDNEKIRYSFVIPVFNGQRTLGTTLQAIREFSKTFSIEIIVVDSSESNECAEIVQGFSEIQYLRSKTRLSVGTARNLGKSKTKGEAIVFLDQDCVPCSKFLVTLEEILSDQRVVAVGGSVAADSVLNLPGMMVYFLEFLYHYPNSYFTPRFMIGCNCVVKSDLAKSTDFPAQTIGEDVIFTERIVNQGATCLYVMSNFVTHTNRKGLLHCLHYMTELGKSSALLDKGPLFSSLLRSWPFVIYFSPPLINFMVLIRILTSRNLRYLLVYLLIAPLCVIGSFYWCIGFYSSSTRS